jgi:hypothetical protein
LIYRKGVKDVLSAAQKKILRKLNEKKLFSELLESMTQLNEIVRGTRAPSRKVEVENNRSARYYEITAAGRRALASEKKEWDRMVSIMQELFGEA